MGEAKRRKLAGTYPDQSTPRERPRQSDMPPFSVHAVDDFNETTDSRTLMAYQAGVRGDLTREAAADAAQQLRKFLTRASPHSPVFLGIWGYDDDPRELHEIPETRGYLGWFATEFDKAGIDETRLIDMSRKMLEIGRHIAAGDDFAVILNNQNAGERAARDVEEFQEAARKKLS